MTNHYNVLSIPSNATQKQIKKAFRRQAKQYHPDVCTTSGGHDKFIAAYKAYDILSNKEKRQLFDELLNKNKQTVVQTEEFEKEQEWENEAQEKGNELAKASLKEALAEAAVEFSCLATFVLIPAVIGIGGFLIGAFNIFGAILFASGAYFMWKEFWD